MELVILWLVLCGLVAWLADSRGRSGGGFFLLSLVLSPLVGLIAALVTEDLKKKAQADRQTAYDQARDHERRLEEIKALRQPAEAPVVAQAGSVADELQKLAGLRDAGVLTEAEFQAQKRAVLART